MVKEIIDNKKIVLYGLSTETERILNEWNDKYNVIGLLDGFKNFGEQFGYPILDINDVVGLEDIVIIVVARPGSCRTIAKKIGDLCRENNVPLFDIRGNDLLAENRVVFDFLSIQGYTKKELVDAISHAEVVSFDLFDTLLVRDIASFDSLIGLVEATLRENNIHIPDFKNKRIQAEKSLSVGAAPKLESIYARVLQDVSGENISAKELSLLEFNIDKNLIRARDEVVDFFISLIEGGSLVYVTSDSYYTKDQITEILQLIGIKKATDILISCECGTSKTNGLFDVLKDNAGTKNILHIGDDIVADIEAAKRYGIKGFQIYSASELFEKVGRFKLEDACYSLSDQIKIGMFIANLFNNPFRFEDESKRIHTDSARNVGYLFCAPMIMDFVKWFEEECRQAGIKNKWLCARDGYLIKKIYEIMYPNQKTNYFYTSRSSSVRAGAETISDIEYVDSMKFSGSCEDNLKTRFGLDAATIDKTLIDENTVGLMKYAKAIIEEAKIKKGNYLKYIDSIDIQSGKIAFFDFVAKGTSQMYVQRLVDNPIRGLYFLQLEPEFMRNKNLDIKTFYTEFEGDSSAIFDNYYILETLLTSPEPSVDEFDEVGSPVFAKETRPKKDIECIMNAQEGILDYVKRYMSICPVSEYHINKKLDELLLNLAHNVEIRDIGFLSLIVEDPFFNRMTNMTDVL